MEVLATRWSGVVHSSNAGSSHSWAQSFVSTKKAPFLTCPACRGAGAGVWCSVLGFLMIKFKILTPCFLALLCEKPVWNVKPKPCISINISRSFIGSVTLAVSVFHHGSLMRLCWYWLDRQSQVHSCFIWVFCGCFFLPSVTAPSVLADLLGSDCRGKPVSRFLLIWNKCPYPCCQEYPTLGGKGPGAQRSHWGLQFPEEVWAGMSGQQCRMGAYMQSRLFPCRLINTSFTELLTSLIVLTS